MRNVILLAALLAATPVAAQHAVNETRPFHPRGNFKIMVADGQVRVRTWDRDSVRVVGTLDARARSGFYFGAGPAGGGKLGFDPEGGSAELEITLPRGTRRWIKSVGAAIAVHDIDEALDLYSVSGSIRVEASPRSVYAESMGGDIDMVGTPRALRLRTGSGDIAVLGGGPDVTATTVSGRVTVRGTEPFRRALIETVSGPVSLAGPLDPGGALSITSHDGPVDLLLPIDTHADFLLSTLEGELRNQLTQTGARKATSLKGRELAFTSGQGGAEVTVRTFSGAVTVAPAR